MVEQVPYKDIPRKEILKTKIGLSLSDPGAVFSFAKARPNAPKLHVIMDEWRKEKKRQAEESKKQAEAKAEKMKKKEEELERERLEKEAAALVKPLLPEFKFNKYRIESIEKEDLDYYKECLDKMRKLLNTFSMGKLPPEDAVKCVAKRFDWRVETDYHCHIAIGNFK